MKSVKKILITVIVFTFTDVYKIDGFNSLKYHLYYIIIYTYVLNIVLNS